MKCRLLCSLLLIALLSACNSTPMGLPKSSTKPREVVVVDSGHAISRILTTPYRGLPQPEPSFDVTEITGSQLTGVTKYARAIVVYDSKVDMKVEHDVYARPQIVIHTNGQNIANLMEALDAFEAACKTSELKASHNNEAEKLAIDHFGMAIWLPSQMKSSKVAKDFLWFSDNSTTTMRNVCLFRLPNIDNVAAEVDSVLCANVPGEAKGSYMRLANQNFTYPKSDSPTATLRVWGQGLWEMEGDAMGGPMAIAIHKTPKGYVAALAFVYAPGKDKRNLIESLKYALYTLSCTK